MSYVGNAYELEGYARGLRAHPHMKRKEQIIRRHEKNSGKRSEEVRGRASKSYVTT